MIEPTDEMGEVWEKARRAYWAALEHDSGEGGLTLAEHEREARKQALAAVFAIVERDYDVLQHDVHPGSPCWKRDWVGEPYLRCEVQATL